jgi:Nucleotidyl transferase AbiEii toxin, Type IV TA system
MSEPRGRLTPLQAEILDSFFALESRFYLTGGGALAGFHLGHREIFANKLCALLGRSEIRDLVDVRALEESGLSLTDGLAGGQRKDGVSHLGSSRSFSPRSRSPTMRRCLVEFTPPGFATTFGGSSTG